MRVVAHEIWVAGAFNSIVERRWRLLAELPHLFNTTPNRSIQRAPTFLYIFANLRHVPTLSALLFHTFRQDRFTMCYAAAAAQWRLYWVGVNLSCLAVTVVNEYTCRFSDYYECNKNVSITIQEKDKTSSPRGRGKERTIPTKVTSNCFKVHSISGGAPEEGDGVDRE